MFALTAAAAIALLLALIAGVLARLTKHAFRRVMLGLCFFGCILAFAMFMTGVSIKLGFLG